MFQASRRGGGARAAGWKLYLIPLVSVSLLLLPLFFVPQYFGPAYPIQIDGKFGDWAGVPKMDAVPPSVVQNPDTDIVRVAVKDNLDYLSFYLEVRGSALAGGPAPQRLTNAFYAFIDVDRARSTGYQIQGIGADRMIRINTWGGAIVSASVWSFNTSRSRTDWNGWIVTGPVYAAGSGGQMEFEASWRDISQTHQPVDVAFASRSWDGQSDASDVVATSADRFLLVSQMTNAPLVASGNGTILAQITLRAVNGPVAVQGINVTFDGTFRVNSISAVDLIDASSGVLAAQPIAAVVQFVFSPITLASGDTRTFSIKPHVSTADGMTVGAFVRGVEDVMVSTGGVAVVGPLTTPTRLAYVGLVPSAPRIDGAFGEWTNLTSDPVGNVQPVWNRDVDLSAHGFRGFGNDTYFEASVVGTMLNGTMVPDLNPAFIPATGNGTSSGTVSAPPPPLTGTDSLRFFLDLDGNVSTGYRVGSLGADFLVEVTGQNGLILTSNALRFAGLSPYDWAWTTRGVAPAAKSGSQIEASVPGVRITNASRAFVQVRGWNGARDDTSTAPPISVLSVNNPWGSLSPTSAALSGPNRVGVRDIAGNQRWFFTNAVSNGTGCSTGNNMVASTTAGSNPVSLDLSNPNPTSICWFTPVGQPASTGNGTWEFYLDASDKTDGPNIFNPNADGAVKQWTSVGSNPCTQTNQYQCVKDDPNDGDTTYIVSTSSSILDSLFKVPSWTPAPPSPLLIINVTVQASCKYVAGSGDVRILARPSSTTFASGTLPTCSSSSYTILSNVWTTNPATGSAWTVTDVNNLQIGVRDNDATTNEVRVSNVRALVYFKPIYSVEIDLCTDSPCTTPTVLYGPSNSNSFANDVLQTASINALNLTSGQRIRFKVTLVLGGTVTISFNGPYPGTSDSRGTIPTSIPEFQEVVRPIAGTLLIAVATQSLRSRRRRPRD